MLWVDGRTAGPELAKRSSSLRSHGLAGDGGAVQARWGGPLRVWLEESRGGRASGREQVPGMRSPGPAQPAETASVFGLRSRLGAFQSLRFRCAAKSGRPVPGPHLILSLPCAGATSHLVTSSSRRPGPKCHRRGCCPLARAESPPRPDIPLCLPPWLGRPPWPTHPLRALPARPALSSDLGAENLSCPFPVLASAASSLGSPSTRSSALCLPVGSPLPSQATRFGGRRPSDSLTSRVSVSSTFPDVMGGQHIFVENLRL